MKKIILEYKDGGMVFLYFDDSVKMFSIEFIYKGKGIEEAAEQPFGVFHSDLLPKLNKQLLCNFF